MSISVPNIFVKGHSVQKLLSIHTDTHLTNCLKNVLSMVGTVPLIR